MLEKHHKVEILDEAIEAAVTLSHRYIPSRQLPDKAISLLDTACARVAVSQHATPAEVEDIERRLSSLEVEQGIIGREEAIGIDVGERKADVRSGAGEGRGRAGGRKGPLGRPRRRWSRRSCRCGPPCAGPGSRWTKPG